MPVVSFTLIYINTFRAYKAQATEKAGAQVNRAGLLTWWDIRKSRFLIHKVIKANVPKLHGSSQASRVPTVCRASSLKL